MASLLDALIQVESNGNPAAIGPKTKYGRALGSTQMLPATAREMALKLGLPFRPDLLTAPTDEGRQYQRQLGEAYLQEGLEKTGNVRDALRYYHGGPNRAQWGAKTNSYAERVMSLAGGDAAYPTLAEFKSRSQPQEQAPMQPYPFIIPDRPERAGEPMPMPQDMLAQPIGVSGQGSLAGMMQLDPSSLQQNMPEQVKPRAFDKGGKGWVIAGIIADAIAGGFGGKGGFAPTYSALQQQEREDARRVAEHRERIEAQRAERMNTPYRFQNNAGDVVELVPGTGQQRILYADPVAKPDWQRIENEDGSITMQPVPSASRPTTQHIQALLANPERAAEFDAKFGQPGLAEAILRGRR